MPNGKRKRQDPVLANPIGELYTGNRRSATSKERNDKLQKKIDDEKEKERLLEQERAEALANQPRGEPGTRGDGQFHMAFVRMGQGDCTIISTPGGQNIMIDCGSDATEAERLIANRTDLDEMTETDKDKLAETTYLQAVKDTVYGPKFLKDKKQLDYLILTHADTDHYNKLKKILEADVQIYRVYHSDDRANYSCDQVSAFLWERTPIKGNIFPVTLDEVGVKKLGDTLMVVGDKDNCLDARGAIRIVNEENCKVSILAANVKQEIVRDNSNLKNRGSVVTLIEVFGKKLLVCGDATRSTEAFIVNTYGDKIAWPLDLVQVPHHGSNVTSSHADWTDKLKAKAAVVSAGKQVIKDHLPSLDTINRYIAHNSDVSRHELYYWYSGGMNSLISGSNFFEKNLYITGSMAAAFSLEITLAADSELTITMNQ